MYQTALTKSQERFAKITCKLPKTLCYIVPGCILLTVSSCFRRILLVPIISSLHGCFSLVLTLIKEVEKAR